MADVLGKLRSKAGPGMPQVIILPAALQGLKRLEAFLRDKNAEAAARVGRTLLKAMLRLGDSPYIGRPAGDKRQLLIRMGRSGYVITYKVVEGVAVYILSVRHGRELETEME